MTASRYAELAARALRAHAEEAPEGPSEAVRHAAIGALKSALARKQHAKNRRVRWPIAIAGLAVAAAVAALFVVRPTSLVTAPAAPSPNQSTQASREVVVYAHPSGAGVQVSESGAVSRLHTEGFELDRGSRVRTDDTSPTLITLSTGTRLTLGVHGDLSVIDRGQEQRFRLDAGTVHACVTKLTSNDRFLIQTADAEVEVRGTAFDVSVVPPAACGRGARTRVVVTEGVVVVRRDGLEARVSAGQSWPSDCDEPDIKGQAPAEVRPLKTASVARVAVATSQAIAQASRLAAQNDLFAQGVASRQKNSATDAAEAVAIFDRFLATYPSSPLAENAAAERMRALASFDPAAARIAAARYLSRYPAGFSRTEANALVSTVP